MMTKATRRLIFYFFILIFVVVTPLTILYATGYSLDWENGKIVRTGAFYLKTAPKAGQVFIDGKNIGTTPILVDHLLPDQYSIKIEKDGFYPWQKTLPVQSRLTTFAENITLFEKLLPAEVVETNSELFSLAPNKEKIGKVTKEQIKEIATTKMPDLNAIDVDSAMKIIEGTARSMGIEVAG